MSDITFGDLPVIARSKIRKPEHEAFVEAAKKNPGKYGLLGSDLSTSIVKSINDGQWEEFAPAGSFHAASRNGGDTGRADIYVAYVGEEKTEPVEA